MAFLQKNQREQLILPGKTGGVPGWPRINGTADGLGSRNWSLSLHRRQTCHLGPPNWEQICKARDLLSLSILLVINILSKFCYFLYLFFYLSIFFLSILRMLFSIHLFCFIDIPAISPYIFAIYCYFWFLCMYGSFPLVSIYHIDSISMFLKLSTSWSLSLYIIPFYSNSITISFISFYPIYLPITYLSNLSI